MSNVKWEKGKEIGKLVVSESSIAYRIILESKKYYIERTPDTTSAYNEDNEKYFIERVGKIKNHNPNRKARRQQERFYNKLIKKAGKKQNIDEAKFKISTKAIDDVNADIAEVAEEAKENIVGAIKSGDADEQ